MLLPKRSTATALVLALSGALAGAMAGALPLAAVAATQSPPKIVVDNAWFTTLPNNGPTYGFFRIANQSGKARLITGYSAPPCSSLKLEEAHSGDVNGKAAVQMTLGAKDRLAFSRGGYHLVCDRGSNVLSPGQTVPVTITLDGGTTVPVSFAVRPYPR